MVPAPCIQAISAPQFQGRAAEALGLMQGPSQMAVEQQPEVVQVHKVPGATEGLEIKTALLEHWGRVAQDFQVATPQGEVVVVAIMVAGAVDTSPREQILHPPAVAVPATRATSAMPPCKRAFAMGMGKSLLPIKLMNSQLLPLVQAFNRFTNTSPCL